MDNMRVRNILIIEDDSIVARTITRCFSGNEYHVQVTNTGIAGLRAARRKLPDLILLDVMMPGMDGYTACKEIRDDIFLKDVPVMFVTAKNKVEDKIFGLSMGADDYLGKPFNLEELLLRVKALLNRSDLLRYSHTSTNLPTGRLIESQLSGLLIKANWAFLDLAILSLQTYREVYGDENADLLLQHTALLIRNAVKQLGTADDFIGNVREGHFIVITSKECAMYIQNEIKINFTEIIPIYYKNKDWKRGSVSEKRPSQHDSKISLVKLAIGILMPKEKKFGSAYEIARSASVVAAIKTLKIPDLPYPKRASSDKKKNEKLTKIRNDLAKFNHPKSDFIDPITELPMGQIAEEYFQKQIRLGKWILLDISIEFFDAFEERYGFLAGDNILRLTSDVIKDVLQGMQISKSIICCLGVNHFIVIFTKAQSSIVAIKLKESFSEQIFPWYGVEKKSVPFSSINNMAEVEEMAETPRMTLAIGAISFSKYQFTNTQEIIDLAITQRRRDLPTLHSKPIRLIEEQLNQLIDQPNIALLSVYICNYESFRQVYGPVSAAEVTQFLQSLIAELMTENKSDYNFIDRAADVHFWIITSKENASAICEKLKARFEIEVLPHYYYIHRKLGYLYEDGHKVPLMKLAVGIAKPARNTKAEAIIKKAENARQKDSKNSQISGD